MKKLLLLLMIQSSAFAQPDVEIRLVDSNVGSTNCYYYSGSSVCNTTNDVGLNTIFSNYGVYAISIKAAHPIPTYSNRIISITGTFPASFITDLLAYSSVIESARVSDINNFSDALQLKIVDINIGTPTGFNSNIVTTNDTGLNQIFQDFNVYYYVQSYPTSTWNTNLRVYKVVCNCDKNLLKVALDNYTTVIESTNYAGAVYLSTNNLEKPKATIAPNPFSDNFTIETNQFIANYAIIDMTGKTIVTTTSKNELDSQSFRLSAGMYLLKLEFENGQTASFKLVKK